MSCDSSFSSYCDTSCTPGSAVTAALDGDPERAREILTSVLDLGRNRAPATGGGEGKLAALATKAARAQARELTMALFRDIRAVGLKAPSHGEPDPSLGFALPKEDTIAGYAAVQETIAAARTGQPLPLIAQQVRFAQLAREDGTVDGDARHAFTKEPGLIAVANGDRPASELAPQIASCYRHFRQSYGGRPNCPPELQAAIDTLPDGLFASDGADLSTRMRALVQALAAAGGVPRCPTCQQWVSPTDSSHTCPTTAPDRAVRAPASPAITAAAAAPDGMGRERVQELLYDPEGTPITDEDRVRLHTAAQAAARDTAAPEWLRNAAAAYLYDEKGYEGRPGNHERSLVIALRRAEVTRNRPTTVDAAISSARSILGPDLIALRSKDWEFDATGPDAQARRDQVFRAACMLADFDSNADPSGVVWHAQHFLREFDDPSHIGVRRAAYPAAPELVQFVRLYDARMAEARTDERVPSIVQNALAQIPDLREAANERRAFASSAPAEAVARMLTALPSKGSYAGLIETATLYLDMHGERGAAAGASDDDRAAATTRFARALCRAAGVQSCEVCGRFIRGDGAHDCPVAALAGHFPRLRNWVLENVPQALPAPGTLPPAVAEQLRELALTLAEGPFDDTGDRRRTLPIVADATRLLQAMNALRDNPQMDASRRAAFNAQFQDALQQLARHTARGLGIISSLDLVDPQFIRFAERDAALVRGATSYDAWRAALDLAIAQARRHHTSGLLGLSRALDQGNPQGIAPNLFAVASAMPVGSPEQRDVRRLAMRRATEAVLGDLASARIPKRDQPLLQFLITRAQSGPLPASYLRLAMLLQERHGAMMPSWQVADAVEQAWEGPQPDGLMTIVPARGGGELLAVAPRALSAVTERLNAARDLDRRARERLGRTRTPQNDVEATLLALSDDRPMVGRGVWLFNMGEFDLALDVLGEVDAAPDVEAAIRQSLRRVRATARGAGQSAPTQARTRAHADRIERVAAARGLTLRTRR